jgi:orotidine-5'-phosphate decarboxylase
MEQSAKKADSKIVLAFDLPHSVTPKTLLSKAEKTLNAVHQHICAVKFNRHLILPLNLFSDVRALVSQVHDYGLPAIMDCKINDIGETNRIIAKYYFNAGFDAVTANPFIGWEDGVHPVFDMAKKMGRGVILLVYMSHKGAKEGYGQKIFDEASGTVFQYMVFARKALKWHADGAVVGATYPERIKEVHSILEGKVPIFSPGVGVQGGNIASAINSGASYLIIGRSIMLARDPSQAAEKFKQNAQQYPKRKRSPS